MAEAPGQNAVISGECRLETVPSADGALLKGLRLELDLRLAPVGADGKGGTLAVLRVERARLGVPGSGVTPHQAWAVAAGVFSVMLSVVLWFALDPQRADVQPVSPAMTELPELPPAPVVAATPANLPAPPPVQVDTATKLEPQPSLNVTPISPSVSLVRAPAPPASRSQPAVAPGRARPSAPKTGLPAPAARAAASVAPAAAPAPPPHPEPPRPVDVLDLFADTK
jgi:hypothetical protein